MVLALNAPTAQYVTDRKKMLKARRGWTTAHPARDRQANCFRVPVLSRETPGECRTTYGALDIERAGIYAKSDIACKFVNMEILKRSAMQISRASNYAWDERATQNYKLPWFVCIFNWFKTEFQTANNN